MGRTSQTIMLGWGDWGTEQSTRVCEEVARGGGQGARPARRLTAHGKRGLVHIPSLTWEGRGSEMARLPSVPTLPYWDPGILPTPNHSHLLKVLPTSAQAPGTEIYQAHASLGEELAQPLARPEELAQGTDPCFPQTERHPQRGHRRHRRGAQRGSWGPRCHNLSGRRERLTGPQWVTDPDSGGPHLHPLPHTQLEESPFSEDHFTMI